MTVYGDLLFLINVSMDFLCFYICCLLLRCPLPLFRTCVASALGGVYSVAALFIVASPLASFLLDVLCCAWMCIAVFWSKKTRRSFHYDWKLYYFDSNRFHYYYDCWCCGSPPIARTFENTSLHYRLV